MPAGPPRRTAFFACLTAIRHLVARGCVNSGTLVRDDMPDGILRRGRGRWRQTVSTTRLTGHWTHALPAAPPAAIHPGTSFPPERRRSLLELPAAGIRSAGEGTDLPSASHLRRPAHRRPVRGRLRCMEATADRFAGASSQVRELQRAFDRHPAAHNRPVVCIAFQKAGCGAPVDSRSLAEDRGKGNLRHVEQSAAASGGQSYFNCLLAFSHDREGSLGNQQVSSG